MQGVKPLQSIAMGYVVIALYARFGSYDLLADPLGWVLVLLGVRRLPVTIDTRVLTVLGGLAFAVSIPIWIPEVVEALGREDPSLAWAADLPAFAFTAMLLHLLGQTALAARDRGAGRSLRLLMVATVVVALLPVLIFGAGWSDLTATASALAELLQLVTIVALFVFASRGWALPAIEETATKSAGSS